MDFTITENDLFTVEHCYSCAIPGYLIVSPKVRASSLAELPKAYQAELGPILTLASSAIQKVIAPIKIYCAQFGEENSHLHFHVFPRTAEITEAFVLCFPDQKELIHGPLILDWARTKYKNTPEVVLPAVSQSIYNMREFLGQISIEKSI